MTAEPIPVVWANPEKTIVLATLPKLWKAEDFIDARARANTLRDEVDHIVHSIVDARHTSRPPTDMLLRMREVNALEHERAGLAVWIVAERTELYTMIFDIYKHLYKYDIPIVPSMEAALTFIKLHSSDDASQSTDSLEIAL